MSDGLRIVTGTVEPIQVFVVDSTNAPLTGKTDLFVRVRRGSDGFYLDFADDTFKSIGWTTRDAALSELDATLAPGLYELTGGLDTGAFTNASADDDLVVIPLQTPGTDAVLPVPEELKVGQFVDLIKRSHQKMFNRREIDFATQKEKLFDDDDATVLGEQTLTDGSGNAIVVLPGAPARIGKFA